LIVPVAGEEGTLQVSTTFNVSGPASPTMSVPCGTSTLASVPGLDESGRTSSLIDGLLVSWSAL
jgi:hypothetical protein